jgi:hypothetical protein
MARFQLLRAPAHAPQRFPIEFEGSPEFEFAEKAGEPDGHPIRV